MTVTVRLTGYANANVDFHIGVGVWSNDDSNEQEYRADHRASLDEGLSREWKSIDVDLPADAHDEGFTECFLTMGDVDLAEPLD